LLYARENQGYNTFMNNKRDGFIIPLFIICIAVVIIVGGAWLIHNQTESPTITEASKIDCGLVGTHGTDMPPYTADAQNVENCFWANFGSGTASTLTLHYQGTDTGSNFHFSTECASGKCQIGGYEQSYSANFRGSKSPEVYFICAALTKDAHGLHAVQCKFKNDTRDILIPAASGPQKV
jgi:hypothetical protein